MLCCKYLWFYYIDSELKLIYYILYLEYFRGILFFMLFRGLMNWLYNRLRCVRCIFKNIYYFEVFDSFIFKIVS